MADEKKEAKSTELGIRSKGHIGLEIGIVVMIGVLIWSLVVPQQEREQRQRVTRLARAKMKVLFHLQYAYLSIDTVYATDMKQLLKFAKTADTTLVKDSVFVPLQKAYMRFEEYQLQVAPLGLKEFRNRYLDSVGINPFSSEPFLLELATKAGRRTFNVKPSTVEGDLKEIGAVINGEIVWDEKAELAH